VKKKQLAIALSSSSEHSSDEDNTVAYDLVRNSGLLHCNKPMVFIICT